MKNIIIILISILSLSVKAQYTMYGVNVKMYSDVWVLNNNMLQPKVGIPSIKVDHIKNAVDINKVREYLLESYNQFRADYGMNPVSENLKLSKGANQYAATLNGKPLVHSKGQNIQYEECMVNLYYMNLSHLDPNKVDINKVIADCYFDVFVNCPAHMASLIKPSLTVSGFGISQNDAGFVICIRSK